MSGTYCFKADGDIDIVALMLRAGFFEGRGEIVPLKFTGIPLRVPSVLLIVRVFPSNAKLTAGFTIF